MTQPSGPSGDPCAPGAGATDPKQPRGLPALRWVRTKALAFLAWVRRDAMWPNLQATFLCLALAALGYFASIWIPYDYAAEQAAVQANATIIAEWRTEEFKTARDLQTRFADEIPKNAFLLRAMAKERLALEALQPAAGDTVAQFQARYQAQKDSRLRPLVEKWLERPGYLSLCLAVKSRFREDEIAARATAISEICGLINEISGDTTAATSEKFRAILSRPAVAADVSESRPSFPIADPASLADAMTGAVESILAETVDRVHAAIQRMEPRSDDTRCAECGARLEAACPACEIRSRAQLPDGTKPRTQETK